MSTVVSVLCADCRWVEQNPVVACMYQIATTTSFDNAYPEEFFSASSLYNCTI